MKPKKLIEVALPIKEISAESVRDKYIHHGHISTLHLWWARRPLSLCRATIFASVVPDPLDDNCPIAFRDAVQTILGKFDSGIDPYKPYDDIPYTAIKDSLEDNLRNRLMMFIAKFSSQSCEVMRKGNDTPERNTLLSNFSLIKYESKNDETILRKARELIWVAYNSEQFPNETYDTHHKQFVKYYEAIISAEDSLYKIPDRHLKSDAVLKAEEKLQKSISEFQNHMPNVFDPFAGGGAIPLEAARLGCRSYGNDINPVAHIIERSSAEFPQKFGKPIVYSFKEFVEKYGDYGVKLYAKKFHYTPTNQFSIPNRLSFDIEYFANLLIDKTKKETEGTYESVSTSEIPVAYYWARTIQCSNPSCGAEIPMMKQFYMSKKAKKNIVLDPQIKGKDISFNIHKGDKNIPSWNNRGNITCPCCGNITPINDVKRQFIQNGGKQRMLCYIFDTPSGKSYKIPNSQLPNYVPKNDLGVISDMDMQKNSGGGDTFSWGITKWKQLYTTRQLDVLLSLVNNLNALINSQTDYDIVIKTYLAILINRVASYSTSFGRWIPQNEQLTSLFGRQAIAMNSDFPEMNIFAPSTSGIYNQLDWIIRYVESESNCPFSCTFCNASSGERTQFSEKELSVVVTDPPYYNAIAYADISDFFYMWFKLTIGKEYPLNFATPQTPKTEECTALKHHHNGSVEDAKKHFENKLTQIFDAIELQTSDVVSIMFAHQSTEAWTTLCNSILSARMNITGSWAIDSERDTRMVANSGSALESSVTVSCRPSERNGFAEYRDVKKDIEKKVEAEVNSLYELGFRGADLLTACFGMAVSEFGHYKTVEKADGSEVTVGELLELARESAFNALLKGVQGDEQTRLYVGWLQLNGMGDTNYDDVNKFTRVGVNIEIKDVFGNNLLIKDANDKIHLATAKEHIGDSHTLGMKPSDPLIAQVHCAMLLYKSGDREKLLHQIRDCAQDANAPFWRLLASLKELLPAGDDAQQVQGLLTNGDDLRHKCTDESASKAVQGKLDFDSDNQ